MNIEIKKLEDALNKYNSNEISYELNNYLINKSLRNFKNITVLNIKSNLSKNEKEMFEEVVHNYYKKLASNSNHIDKNDNYIQLILLLLGFLLILISKEIKLFSEILLITGWVFIWEMLYDVLFNQIKRKRKANIYKKLSTCKINFTK